MKRLAKHTVDLAEIARRTRPEQLTQLHAFNSRCQRYAKQLTRLPAQPPAIDWAHYKANVSPAHVATVEHFCSAYEALRVPEPQDTQSAEVDAQLVAVRQDIASFVAASEQRICALQAEIDAIRGLLPFDQMTMEDFIDAFPGQGPDFLNRPTFWPHTREEQPLAGADGMLAGEAHLLQQICGLRERIAARIQSGQRARTEVNGAVGDVEWKAA